MRCSFCWKPQYLHIGTVCCTATHALANSLKRALNRVLSHKRRRKKHLFSFSPRPVDPEDGAAQSTCRSKERRQFGNRRRGEDHYATRSLVALRAPALWRRHRVPARQGCAFGARFAGLNLDFPVNARPPTTMRAGEAGACMRQRWPEAKLGKPLGQRQDHCHRDQQQSATTRKPAPVTAWLTFSANSARATATSAEVAAADVAKIAVPTHHQDRGARASFHHRGLIAISKSRRALPNPARHPGDAANEDPILAVDLVDEPEQRHHFAERDDQHARSRGQSDQSRERRMRRAPLTR